MQVATTCPRCGSGTQLEVSSVEQPEYVSCPDCGHRFLREPTSGDAPDGAVSAGPEPHDGDELDWGDAGEGEGQLAGPSGMAFDAQDNIWIVNTKS